MRAVSKRFFGMLGAHLLPLAIAVPTIPILIENLGQEAFGAFSILWTALNLIALWDLGLGVTLAPRLAREEVRSPAAPNVGAAAAICIGFGAFLAAVVWMTASGLAAVLVSDELRLPFTNATRLVSLSFGPAIATGLIQQALEARQNIRQAGQLRLIGGSSTLLLPAAASHLWPTLTATAIALTSSRLITFSLACYFAFIRLRAAKVPTARLIRSSLPAAATGGWVMVSRLLSPLIVNADRAAIALFLGPASLSSYVPASELGQRSLVLPAAAVSANFGALAGHQLAARAHAARLSSQLGWWMAGMAACAGLLGPRLMAMWLGHRVGDPAQYLLGPVLLAMTFNAIAQFPMTICLVGSRKRAVAMLHLAEAVAYPIVLAIAVPTWGLPGALVCFIVRALADGVVLLSIARVVPRKLGLLAVGLCLSIVYIGLGLLDLGPAACAVLGILGAIFYIGLGTSFFFGYSRGSLGSAVSSLGNGG